MIKLVDLNYIRHYWCHDLRQAIDVFSVTFKYIEYLKGRADVVAVKHLSVAETAVIDDIIYTSFKSSNRFFYLPFKTNRFVKAQKPDVVLNQSLMFPLRLIALKLILNKKTRIITQHHGEIPFQNSVKRWLQKWADKYTDAYLFTSKGNSKPWIDAGIISSVDKCYEVLEASTSLSSKDRKESMQRVGMSDGANFMWVGRLNANKDPLAVLSGFDQYLQGGGMAKLYMIYQDDTMLADVERYIKNSAVLINAVHLIGKVEHDELAYWYSAADFYISGSHREGSGYALIECMACGCIPVVTNIPPFKTITDDGHLAIMFEPGDAEGISKAIRLATGLDKQEWSGKIVQHFNDRLSFKAIADDIYNVCTAVMNK